MNQYTEHLAHSAPCNSQYDGYEHNDNYDLMTIGKQVIGRMTNHSGNRVEIIECWCDNEYDYEVRVNKRIVHMTINRNNALTVAKQWMLA